MDLDMDKKKDMDLGVSKLSAKVFFLLVLFVSCLTKWEWLF